MPTRVLRVGGVAEPFNLPWIRAFERAAFSDLGIEVTFTEFAGGTGALVTALEAGTIDLATLLTEGAVTAIARGSGVRLHSSYTASPLTWGVHTAATSPADSIADLADQRFAISRPGSGSELMAYVLAEQQGWTLNEDQFVVVGGIDGAIEALPAGEAEIFLWERYVTAPVVAQGVFKRVDDLATPWPAFYTAAKPGLLDHERSLVDAVVRIVLSEASSFMADPDAAAAAIAERYGMADADCRSWLAGIAWPDVPLVDARVLTATMQAMANVGRIEAPIPVADLC